MFPMEDGWEQVLPSAAFPGIWAFGTCFINYHGQVDLDFVKMVSRFPGKPPAYPTLEEADAAYYKTQGKGWDAKMCDLENALVGIMLPHNGNEGLVLRIPWVPGTGRLSSSSLGALLPYCSHLFLLPAEARAQSAGG